MTSTLTLSHFSFLIWLRRFCSRSAEIERLLLCSRLLAEFSFLISLNSDSSGIALLP